jgi:large subunit ribosomal protein L6
MSRVGRKLIQVPGGVTVSVEGRIASVKGPKGEISRSLPTGCRVEQEGNVVKVARESEGMQARSMHGLARTLLHNMIIGVTDGFGKDLEIVGVGYKAEVKGKELFLTVGFSEPVAYKIPEGIKIETPAATQIKISGVSKELVGQVASEIRRVRPPEPYKGKGIKYAGEIIHRKAGKTAVGS